MFISSAGIHYRGNHMTTEITEATGIDHESDPESAPEDRTLLARVRTGTFYLTLLLTGVLTVLVLPDLLVLLALGWTAATAVELGIHRLHLMGIATVVAVFLLGLFVQAYRPRERVASMWGAFLIILFVTIATVWFGVGRPEEVITYLVLAGIALVAHPAGRELFRRGDTFSPALLALVAVAAVPLLAFVGHQFGLSGSPTDSHALDGHYVMMAGLAFAPLAYGVVAALGVTGWRLTAWLAALPMAYYGLLSVSFPAQSGSTGLVWGIAAIVWAVAFVAVAEYSRQTTSTTIRRPTVRAT